MTSSCSVCENCFGCQQPLIFILLQGIFLAVLTLPLMRPRDFTRPAIYKLFYRSQQALPWTFICPLTLSCFYSTGRSTDPAHGSSVNLQPRVQLTCQGLGSWSPLLQRPYFCTFYKSNIHCSATGISKILHGDKHLSSTTVTREFRSIHCISFTQVMLYFCTTIPECSSNYTFRSWACKSSGAQLVCGLHSQGR